MKKNRSLSIAARTFLTFAVFSAVMLLILWLLQSLFFDTFYKSVKRKRSETAMTAILSALDENSADMQDQVLLAARYYDVCVDVLDDNLNPIVIADIEPNCMIHNRDMKNEIARMYFLALKNDGAYTETFQLSSPEVSFLPDEATGGRWVFGQRDLVESTITIKSHAAANGKNYTVVLNSMLTPVRETSRTLLLQLTYLSVFILILSLALSYFFSRSLARPIAAINAQAKDLAKGEFGITFSGNTGSREVDELAATLNKATHDLSQIDRLRNELIANFSHDLRTPLTMIAGYAEVMRDVPGENTPEHLNTIIAESRRLTDLVNDLLSISTVRDDTVLTLTDFCITDKVATIIDRLSRFTELQGYTITFHPGERLFVSADEQKIDQVLFNLITNSINYTGSDKCVFVTQKTEDECVRIEVRDTGSGIAEEDLPHIFERYFRGSNHLKRPVVGNGLGLSIVRSVLDSHRTQFGVDSAPGVGSTFWFRLKRVEPGGTSLDETRAN